MYHYNENSIFYSSNYCYQEKKEHIVQYIVEYHIDSRTAVQK